MTTVLWHITVHCDKVRYVRQNCQILHLGLVVSHRIFSMKKLCCALKTLMYEVYMGRLYN